MSLIISQIKNKTLQEYAKEVNCDKNGILDEQECKSLFNSLERDEAKYCRRSEKTKENKISQSLITGLLTAGGLSAFSKNYRNWKSFGLMGIAFSFGSYVGNTLYEKYNESKRDDIKAVKEEYKTLMTQAA